MSDEDVDAIRERWGQSALAQRLIPINTDTVFALMNDVRVLLAEVSRLQRELGDLAAIRRQVAEMQSMCDAAVSAIVYLTENYGGKLHNSWYAEHPDLGALIAAEHERWEQQS